MSQSPTIATTDTIFTWPPAYTLRYSTRVRAVKLQICAQRGLQLIVPPHFKVHKAPAILHEHRQWIERTWRRIQPSITATTPETFPEQLDLLALNERWAVNYQASELQSIRLETIASTQLILHGGVTHQRLVHGVLQRWLLRRAKQHLLPWLLQLSMHSGLSYKQAGIRNTTTRWGSCSVHKNISLNCKLLFLPPELVEHVLLHELCHTIHLNHSRRFWSLLTQLNPDCHRLRQELKRAQRYIPTWLEK